MPTYRFTSGKWQKLEDLSECKSEIREVKCLTMNVWFDDFKREERFQAVMAMIEQSDAEFVCL